mmetsp:Transcript_24829/g.28701  ORF Transcript_24829/g.28701 Transcript_24829/m.28701 type:complete len:256 (+) Transcript_24829:134-901(+)
MSKTNKTNKQNLLTPHFFISSVTKLNINPGVQKGHTKKESAAKTSSSSSTNDNSNVVYTNEAIELLRHCHGQFISLLSSELASGEVHTSTSKKTVGSTICSTGRTSSKKRKLKNDNDDESSRDNNVNNNNVETTASANGANDNNVRSIVPQRVIGALENLEFDNIVSEIQKGKDKKNVKVDNDDGGTGDNKDNKDVKSNNTKKESREDSRKRKKAERNSKKRKMKNAFKNVALAAELLAEQERLFALSAEKAKNV